MPREINRRLFPYAPSRWVSLCIGLGLATVLSGCLFDSAAFRINKQIESGDVTKALTKLEDKLADTPDDPAFNLLAIKARLKLCLERSCFSEGPMPQLLTPLPRLANYVTGPVQLKEELPPLTLAGVLQDAIKPYAAHSNQPLAVIALYTNTPKALQPQSAEALFQPVLTRLHHGQTTEARTVLATLAGHKQAEIPASYAYAANLLSALLNHEDITSNTSLIALRTNAEPRLPESAAAVLPWALMAKYSTEKNTPLDTLTNLPTHLTALNMPATLDARATHAITQELVAASRMDDAVKQWQKGSQADAKLVQLRLQQAALELNPNQPELWASYLPTLVSHTLLTSPSVQDAAAPEFNVTAITSATAPKLANLIMPAVRRLANYPVIAAPLLTFTGKLPLSNPQQVEYQKLSQDLILKASAMGDVSTTLLLAQSLPDAAQNNRHSVVPLLVGYIRQNLREGNFIAATNTANLLTQTLRMDIEFDPLILEEFSESVKTRKIAEQLKATTPELLLKEKSAAALDLGPLFAFMEEHFASQPKVISGQLTTLISKAEGTYGQPTAMYRLGSYFPASTVSPEQQVQWLGAALEQALLADTTLSATQLADTATRLADIHPGLNLAPVMETALKRASQLEDQRTLWHNATPRVREVLRAIRPEFTQLMTGIDAISEGRLNRAALAFADITQPVWREEAKPFLEQFHQRLLNVSGIYIPLSGVTGTKTAAIILEPQGLSANGKLTLVSATFISRGGLTAEPEPETMRTNGMAVHRFTAAVPYNFDTTTLTLEAQTLARTEQGGTFASTYGDIRTLAVQSGTTGAPLLTVTDARGTQTTYLRALVDTTTPLRPDGTYLIQAALGQSNAPTAYILPKGSLLTLTSKPELSAPPANADTKALSIYALEGSLRHPASTQELQFTGYFDPATLLSTFNFSYPLPASGQPAAASVRCQTLAGPITCGAHNQNSARQAYIAHVTGMQTRESMTTSAAMRDIANTEGTDRLLTEAAKMPDPVAVATPIISVTTPVTLTTETVPTLTTPTTVVTPTQIPSATTVHDDEEELEEDLPVSPTTVVPASSRFSSQATPAEFINNSGSKTTSATTQVGPEDDAEPGAFIDLTGRSKTPSATTPVSPTAQ